MAWPDQQRSDSDVNVVFGLEYDGVHLIIITTIIIIIIIIIIAVVFPCVAPYLAKYGEPTALCKINEH